MYYILRLMGGEKFKITEQEYKQIGNAKGLVYIKSCSSTINVSSIASIYPEERADALEDRRKQLTGVLHDGTRVRRHFGRWIKDEGFVPDDNGDYQPVRIDPVYYPEVGRDCVPTEHEWDRIKSLSANERRSFIANLGGGRRTEKISEPQAMKYLIKEQYENIQPKKLNS